MIERRGFLAGLGLLPLAPAVLAQDAETKEDELVEYLFVQSAANGVLKKDELRLTGVAPSTIYFSDRPKRIAGQIGTKGFVESWGVGGKESFKAIPPNGAFSILIGSRPQEVIVELKEPRLEKDSLIYTVKVLEGEEAAEGDACSLFIDPIGMPLTPTSFAGVHRRTRRRTRRRVRRRHGW